MECGDIDLAHVLQQQKTKLNINFIRVYWEQVFFILSATFHATIFCYRC